MHDIVATPTKNDQREATPMRGHTIAHIFSRLQITPAESIILQIVAHAGNAYGQRARLSYEVLAARSGFSRQWVITLVSRLEAKALLRVERVRLSPTHNAVNVYSVVRPWLRELNIKEALARKQEARAQREADSAQTSSQRRVYSDYTKKKNPLPPANLGGKKPGYLRDPVTVEEAINLNITPGGYLWKEMGLPE